MSQYDTLLVEKRGFALWITLNRPERRNALNGVMVEEIQAALSSVAEDREVRAIVLRGAGGHFCAGGDVSDMAAARGSDDPEAVKKLNRSFGTLVRAVERAPQVVVALLEGAVLGGGFGVACVSDIAVAAEDAKFGMPEATLGIPPAQIALFVERRIGLSQARRLALTGARFDGARAAELGLVHEVVPADELEAAAERMLDEVAGCAPEAIAATKRVLLAEGDIESRLDEAAAEFARAATSAEAMEGMTAFLEKRKPGWATSEERA
jgi:isohexenylglutaconyl-CoA hydratase